MNFARVDMTRRMGKAAHALDIENNIRVELMPDGNTLYCYCPKSAEKDLTIKMVWDILTPEDVAPFTTKSEIAGNGYQSVLVTFYERPDEALENAQTVAEWAKSEKIEYTLSDAIDEVFVFFPKIDERTPAVLLQLMADADLPAPDRDGLAWLKGEQMWAVSWTRDTSAKGFDIKTAQERIDADEAKADAIFWPPEPDLEAKAQELATAILAHPDRPNLVVIAKGRRVVVYNPNSDVLPSRVVVNVIPFEFMGRLKYECGEMPKTDGTVMEFMRLTILADNI